MESVQANIQKDGMDVPIARLSRVTIACLSDLNTFFLSIPLLLLGLLFYIAPAQSNVKSVVPDFYSEPGLNPFRDQVNFNVHPSNEP